MEKNFLESEISHIDYDLNALKDIGQKSIIRDKAWVVRDIFFRHISVYVLNKLTRSMEDLAEFIRLNLKVELVLNPLILEEDVILPIQDILYKGKANLTDQEYLIYTYDDI